ncbi:ComF family protein [Flavobacterium sp. Fl-77]|uniref:ComF family protein n=1 Tax=Flavobacterium flavipigmentatum TaxID=2893884 RepID=A0AAJ2S5N0_9FLAO|nr:MULTISPECIES: ComF family protein [unclassified Flavobacterium]MDX6180801.1 ComF family protein [Flavobacterium sp. Fl-33]MDX6184401.1 ComF family protein [Flavobacterium sp. Fl-77]UFH39510.1 ComF family protein [Flavobacterium sp. F-70]
MFKYIIDLFFPKVCAGCRTLLTTNEIVFCSHCRHEMPLTQYHLDPENEAVKKFYGKIEIQHASAFLYFNKKGIVQELIHNLKYKGMEEIGTVLGNWYGEDLKLAHAETPFDMIIPVPLHQKKRKERGYNQVTTFGQALSDALKIKYDDSILYRKKYSKTQSKKNLLGRSENIENIFDVILKVENHDKHFLIIDDVITTGATLEACSRALLKIPGAKISIACMAIAH